MAFRKMGNVTAMVMLKEHLRNDHDTRYVDQRLREECKRTANI